MESRSSHHSLTSLCHFVTDDIQDAVAGNDQPVTHDSLDHVDPVGFHQPLLQYDGGGDIVISNTSQHIVCQLLREHSLALSQLDELRIFVGCTHSKFQYGP